MVTSEEDRDIMFEEDDIPYEEEILRNPCAVKCWLRYIDHKKGSSKNVINMVYERALKELPGSYKLWYSYLKLRRNQIKGRCITDPAYDDVNNAHERALVFMHKMPRIWMDYCQLLVSQEKITYTRHTFDRALRALPLTQHRRVWPIYIKFIRRHNIPETGLRVYRRYMKLCPENAEEFIDYLIKNDRLDEAAIKLGDVVNDEKFTSKEGKSKHQLWHDLCDLMTKNPDKVKSMRVDAIIRQGIKRFTDQIGLLWNSLADYYTRNANFEKAKDIYEEAIQTVTTVRDFTQVFDAYAQFEESVISGRMENDVIMAEEEDELDLELEMRLARMEDLMDRRPLLLNSVLLRQNPHNVAEWLTRVELYEGKPHEQIATFTEAVQTVDPTLATGKLNSLWVAFAKFYDNHDQIDDARIIFEKAIGVGFKQVDDLASVWSEWAEMEIRHENHDDALKLMQRATALPETRAAYHDASEPVQNRIYRNLKLWSLYADLEESFGTFKTTKAVYDKIIELRIATPQIIMNFGMFLEENNYFEEAFKAYEKGVSLFRWPNVFDIWNTYLTKFIARYGGKKLERARDLFEQCLADVPPKFAKGLYLLFCKLEEEHGMARHAMAIYDRAIGAVQPEERYEMFNVYLKRAAEIYGVTYTREIYEKAIETLDAQQAINMCLRFSDLERKLGEIDRGRAIYAHCAQMCDPRVSGEFWDTWKTFEVAHGNEDTVREMLRIKRSVQATFNTQVNFMTAQMLANASGAGGGAEAAGGDSMQSLEKEAEKNAAAAPSKQAVAEKMKGGNILFVRGEKSNEQLEERVQAVANPDEIDIDDDDEEEDEEEAAGSSKPKSSMGIEKAAIPKEVFGGLKKTEDSDSD